MNIFYYAGDSSMSNEYADLANDILIDKVLQKADELNIQDDNLIDELIDEEFQKLLNGEDNDQRKRTHTS